MGLRFGNSFGRSGLAVALVVAVAACGGGDDDDADDESEDGDVEAVDDVADDADMSDADAGAAGDDSTAGDDASGDDDAAGDDASGGDDAGASSAASWIEIDGETYEFTSVSACVVGDSFWGPDFRRITLDNGGDYPGITVGYAPPKADDEGVEDPNGVALYPSVDPWWYTTDVSGLDDFDITLTADGVTGSATLGVMGEGGPDGEFAATFELSCGDAAEGGDGAGGGDTGDTGDTGGTDAAPDVDTGTFTLGEETYEMSGPSRTEAMLDSDLGLDPNGEFDFDICETVNPAFEGDFNIAGTLGDGTPFRLSGNVD